GLDLKSIQRAQAEKKPILELESSLEQIKLLTNMSPQLQEAFLENAIYTLEQGRTSEQVTGVVNAWQLGDANMMVEIAEEVSRGGRMVDQLNDILLNQRHPAMLEKTEGYLASSQTHFVAVGALHLVGKLGLIELLKARGYVLKQL
ncbi:MAG: TraB/GumN family protein, partial [Pseudomonadota bacterium]